MAKHNFNNSLTMDKYNINNQSQPGGVKNVMKNGIGPLYIIYNQIGGEKHHDE